jgi:hypothetical protein
MPLRLSVGVSKKVGLPGYGSAGATCGLEVELDAGALGDLDAFHERARSAYVACHQAVHDELARLTAPPPGAVPAAADGRPRRNGRAAGAGGRPRTPATPCQARALGAIAWARGIDLEGLLRHDYDVDRPEGLSLEEAGRLIDRLKAAAVAAPTPVPNHPPEGDRACPD